MPWYCVTANHGPGHQSTSTFYMWRDKPLTKIERRDLWSDMFDNFDYEWPIGNTKAVRKLPEKIRLEKIQDSKHAIRFHRKMLSILKEDDT